MQAMKWCMLALALNAAGCATYPKVSMGRVIDIDTSPWGPRYLQDGVGIDQVNMTEELAYEPDAASDVATARVLRVTSLLLAAAGGGMVGWPVGQAIAGERKPLWPLAGAGAVAITLSIPLTALAVFSMDNAVKSHNRGLGSKDARAGSPSTLGKAWMRPVSPGAGL